MSEKAKTAVFVVVAVALAATAYLAVPAAPTPEVFTDQGQPFWPSFDPLDCTSLQVVDYSESEGGALVFKVQFKDGRWTIPSHEDYPADAEHQLSRVAAAVNGLKKGVIRSESKNDWATYGVVDPLDTTRVDTRGRGKRVTLEARTGKVLCDLIIGRAVEGRPGYYYVRRPDEARTYACKIDASSISTRFSDWVDTDLLKASSYQIRRIELDNYHVDEQRATLVPGELIALTKDDAGKWTLEGGLAEDEELDTEKISTMTRTLADMTLAGVRRKPAELLSALKAAQEGKAVSLAQLMQLQLLSSAGFFLVRDDGGLRLVSNEGEMRVYSDRGAVYTLRFGEVAYGATEGASAGQEAEQSTGEAQNKQGKKGAENRYLLISVRFDKSLLGPPPTPPEKPKSSPGSETKGAENEPETGPEAEYKKAKDKYDKELKDYQKKVDDARKRVEQLQDRFAEWYYLISADVFDKLHLSRADLVKKKPPEPAEKAGAANQAEPAGEEPSARPAPKEQKEQQPVK